MLQPYADKNGHANDDAECHLEIPIFVIFSLSFHMFSQHIVNSSGFIKREFHNLVLHVWSMESTKIPYCSTMSHIRKLYEMHHSDFLENSFAHIVKCLNFR